MHSPQSASWWETFALLSHDANHEVDESANQVNHSARTRRHLGPVSSVGSEASLRPDSFRLPLWFISEGLESSHASVRCGRKSKGHNQCLIFSTSLVNTSTTNVLGIQRIPPNCTVLSVTNRPSLKLAWYSWIRNNHSFLEVLKVS